MIFRGNDNGTFFTAFSFDMSEAGTAAFSNDIVVNGDQIRFINDAASSYVSAADALILQSDYNTGENKPIYLQPSAVTEVTVSTGKSTFVGDVGIGTTSPSSKLEVYASGSTVLDIQGSQGQLFSITDDLTGDLFTVSDISGVSIFNVNASGTSYFDDKVGIGTTSPTSLLEISQQLSAASTIDYPYTISSRDDGNLINQAGGEGVGIKFRIAGNDSGTPGDSLVGASIAAIRESASDTDSSTGLGFFITQNDETLDEALRIDHDGKVGIGTTNPSYKLDVHGDGIALGAAAFAKYDSNNDLFLIGDWDGAGADMAIYDGNTSEVVRIANGKVGIGTDSPIDELHVDGIIQSKKHLLPSTSGTAGWYKIGTLGSFVQGGSTAVIEIAGHVGYNATNTQDYLIKLFIKTSNGSSTGSGGAKYNSWYERTGGNSNTIELKWDNSATNDYDLYMFIPTHSLRSWYSVTKGTGTWVHAGTSATDPGANSASVLEATGLFNILDTNVGIGTTSPTYKLDVAGTIRATGDVLAFSDRRVKENIKTIENASDKLLKLRGVEYNKIGETKKSIGVIAQEIEEVLPEVVSTDTNGMKSVAYGNITGVLIEAIKELKAEIEELKKQIK